MCGRRENMSILTGRAWSSKSSQKRHENVPEVTGLTVDKVTLYKALSASEPDKLDTVIRVADLLNQEGLTPDEIRYSTKEELILIFEKLNVLMGETSLLSRTRSPCCHPFFRMWRTRAGT